MMMEAVISEYLHLYGVIAVFILMSANGFASSPPSELILALSGFWVSIANALFYEVYAAAVLGNIVGTYLLYLIGRHIGPGWLYHLKDKLMMQNSTMLIGRILPDRVKIEFGVSFINKHGSIWICILRCMPIVRSIISLPAGIAKMPHGVFLLYSTVGIMFWAGLWMSIGYVANSILENNKWFISIILFSALLLVAWLLKKQVLRVYAEENGKNA